MLVLVIASIIATTVTTPRTSDAQSGIIVTGIRSPKQRCLPLRNGWRRRGCEFGELATVNLLEMKQDQLVWNGRAISRGILQSYLSQTHRLSPRPGIAFVVDRNSSKRRTAVIRRTIEARVGCGFVSVCVEYTASEWRRTQPPKGRNVR